MKKQLFIAAVLTSIAAMTFAAQDWRGTNRLQGTVVDQKTGAPVKSAKLALRIQKGEKGGPDLTADNNGKWSILGLGAGAWNIDVEAPGYVTRQMSVSISEGQRLPPMKIELEPQAQQAAQAEPAHEELKIGGQTVSKEVAAAVDAGNAFIGQKKYKEAVAEYEKAVAALPDYMPLQFALARAYYGGGDLKKAIASMDRVYKADPANVQNALLYANMLLENGQLTEGKEVINKVPSTAVTDPTPLVNVAIVLMNKKQPAGAIEYLTKAITVAPSSPDGYYYRGLAYIQAGKAKDAKPDLQKVIELAPTSEQATEAREYLKSIK